MEVPRLSCKNYLLKVVEFYFIFYFVVVGVLGGGIVSTSCQVVTLHHMWYICIQYMSGDDCRWDWGNGETFPLILRNTTGAPMSLVAFLPPQEMVQIWTDPSSLEPLHAAQLWIQHNNPTFYSPSTCSRECPYPPPPHSRKLPSCSSQTSAVHQGILAVK